MQIFNVGCLRSIHLNHCICGFGSAYIYLLGLYEFCDRHNINFSFDKNGVMYHYTQNNKDIWDNLFECEFLIKSQNSDRKYHCNLSIPPSPNPFFNFHAIIDENCCITKEWAYRLNPYLKYIQFKESNYIKKYDLSDSLPLKYFGLHMRGTDAHTHGQIDLIEKKLVQIKENFEKSNCEKIFLMTDDQKYFDAITNYFGKNVIFVTNVIRSMNSLPLHEAYKNNYHEYSQKSIEHLQDLFFELKTLTGSNKCLMGISAITPVAKVMNPELDITMFGDRKSDMIHWKNEPMHDSGIKLIEL
jgi:hypothetical protein